MSYFEFLMVLIGLVGAIAISEILLFWGQLVRSRHEMRRPTLFLIATIWMVLNLIGHITGIWAYRNVEFDGQYQSFLVVLPILLAALSVTVLVPSEGRASLVDLDDHYFAVARPAFAFATAHILMAFGADQLPGAQGVPPLWFMPTLAGLLLVLALSRDRRVHYGCWIAHFIIMFLPVIAT